MTNYSIDELRNLGFSDEQIAAINRVKVANAKEQANARSQADVIADFREYQNQKPPKVDMQNVKQRNYVKENITNLSNVSDSTIVELPPFGDGTPFIARLRRPSMLKLCKDGIIPNTLLSQATTLFTSDNKVAQKISITEIYDICEIICIASFVEPTYEEICDSGIQLTDEQIMAVFQYSQGGIKALEKFRNQ